MKKAISIALLAVFLFNVGGYYVVLWGLRLQVNQKINARLDAGHYEAEETIELKIPLHLPYPIKQNDYQRTSGKFEYQGEFYHKVKQKHHHDTLYVICFKDVKEKYLVNTITDYVKLSNDLPGTTNKALNFLGKLLKDFVSIQQVNFEQTAPWISTITFCEISLSFQHIFQKDQSPPPKV